MRILPTAMISVGFRKTGFSETEKGYERSVISECEVSGSYLARTVPDKPNSRNQRYLTAREV